MIIESAQSTRDRAHEEDLLVGAVRNDRKAFVQLYDRYLTPIYRYLVSRVSDPRDAEDLTSQVFLTALERFSQYRSQGKSFAAWLFTIARNKSIDFYRTRRVTYPLNDITPLTDGQYAVRITGVDDPKEQVQEIIRSFPPEEREVIYLRFAADLTYGEIGQMLNRSDEAVKKQVHRLLARIEGILEADHE